VTQVTRRSRVELAAAAGLLLVAAGCGVARVPGGAGGAVEVVAAESCWGSIAAQLGGQRAHVTSIVANPATDPHDYEATPRDARAVAQAAYVIVNGAGYDSWMQKLLGASPASARTVLVVADFLGKRDGDNPHFWYSPAYVDRVVDRIAGDLAAADRAHASYFQERGTRYRTSDLAAYHEAVAAIRGRHAGTPVGATESAFSYLADGLGLDLVTPYSYLKAVSDGSEPSAADRAEVQAQVDRGEIKVLVFNSQNATPDVRSVVDRAAARGIPVVTVTETLEPANASFQDWQTRQLDRLLAALGG
jgi:zinc/manganese transport system substrate-binding protein